jgi:hypothetical protein
MRHILNTGQTCCYNDEGQQIACPFSGQDADLQVGIPWPTDRYTSHGEVVIDHLTGLTWTQDANISTFPCTWQEAFEQINTLNKERYGGYTDWRLPNRNELRSTVSYQTRKPALQDNHPFKNVFLGWYWSSTTALINPAYAWSIHLEGARMFYGRKDQYQLFWPVRGQSAVLPATGQRACYDNAGHAINCSGTGQDGELLLGKNWPQPRFREESGIIHDRLTGLGWASRCNFTDTPVNWLQALTAVQQANIAHLNGINHWRLPNINELTSLVDCSRYNPALPEDYPFQDLQDEYWSSTTSFFETDWAWVLYLNKGACGVGYKPGKTFFVWPVTTFKSC